MNILIVVIIEKKHDNYCIMGRKKDRVILAILIKIAPFIIVNNIYRSKISYNIDNSILVKLLVTKN